MIFGAFFPFSQYRKWFFTCDFHLHTLFLLCEQKLRARRLSRVILGSLCRDFNGMLYMGPKQPELQEFGLSAVPKVIKLLTQVVSKYGQHWIVPTPSGLETTSFQIFARLRWVYGALVLQPKKTPKNTKKRYFCANSVFVFFFSKRFKESHNIAKKFCWRTLVAILLSTDEW